MLDCVSLSLKSLYIYFLSRREKSRTLCFPLPHTLRICVLSSSNDNMQRRRDGRDDFFHSGDQLGSFGGYGDVRRSHGSMMPSHFGERDHHHRSMMPSHFGERDPFDDPFFTRPYGSLFDSGSGERRLNEEDEGTWVEKDNHQKHSRSIKEPSVEHLDYETDEEHSQASRVGVQTCRVTYGGVNGAYYTSTRTTRAGTDGVMLEESKEADRTTGQAKHRISRGIHDKGHSVTRKFNSDGKTDTLQTLHNLNEDELAGFEGAWKGNAQGNLLGQEDGFHMHGNAGSSCSKHKKAGWGGWALPSVERHWKAGGMKPDNEARNNFHAGRTKKAVRINIE
ncbi:uncharacterized protein LOC132188312 isoform X2 [Corylus avellana]|uniref:uncharacterized protein LOC132188312 isoform X2 n=1 Tax=Corylus avellana TaxID=13451 RepID=UPI00286CB494|nr:uncharacterized protein LOC132188312 isoform X2 [Corylus avellana]